MKKIFLFTFDLLYWFIISLPKQDELRDKFNDKLNLGIFDVPKSLRFIIHPLLLCLRTFGVSWFFKNIVSSRYFFLKITPLNTQSSF